MSTVADILTFMGVMDNELDVAASGADEARAIQAINMAQHQFEAIASEYPKVGQTAATTVATIANTEQTAFPSTLLRLDAIWYLDPTTSLPVWKLKRITEVGGHVPSLPYPLNLALAVGTGAPSGYYANMADFFWLPLPDGVSTLRIYGLFEAAEYTARANTFTYPARLKGPFAEFATQLLSRALGDTDNAVETLASAIFRPVCIRLKKFDRSEPVPRTYSSVHTT